MKRVCLCMIAALLIAFSSACAEGVTLKTVSTFAGADAAADTYVALLKAWQEETGNTVIDDSATSDEDWKNGVLKDFAAGNEADILFFFAHTAESTAILNKVVPISELNEAYPDLQFPEWKEVTEEDGEIYAIPVRPFWEGLFCNTDLFESYGLELPTTWEKLEIAIQTFREAGIVPISISLSDVPHYIAEACILSCASIEDFQARPKEGESVPQSWIDGMLLIRRLYEMGAFPSDVNATSESAASALFREKKAAMQIDGSWFANSLSSSAMETTVVIPFPAYSEEAEPTAYLYGVSMGFYLTRSAWRDDARRDAAVDLLYFLSTGENASALGVYNLSGALLESYTAMVDGAVVKCRTIQDDMQLDARGKWFSAIPGIVDGSIEPETLWAEIMEMDPFAGK